MRGLCYLAGSLPSDCQMQRGRLSGMAKPDRAGSGLKGQCSQLATPQNHHVGVIQGTRHV